MMKGKPEISTVFRAVMKTMAIVLILISAISCTVNVYTYPTETVTKTVTEESSADIVQPEPSTAEPAEITETPVDSTEPEKKYVGSVNSNKYHRPDCEWAKKISPANEIWFSSASEAEAAGYVPCKVCNPPSDD